jgi:hypothetical protein
MDERFWIRRLPWKQKNKAETKSAQVKFSPRLEITRERGWQNLELRLINRSSWAVWVEEVNVVLADLVADLKTAVPPERIKLAILQNVNPRETVDVNFDGVIHDAAGRPQGPYTCLVLTDVRYRVFDEWCNAKLGAYRVEMEALGSVGLRSARWYDKKMDQINARVDPVTTGHKR